MNPIFRYSTVMQRILRGSLTSNQIPSSSAFINQVAFSSSHTPLLQRLLSTIPDDSSPEPPKKKRGRPPKPKLPKSDDDHIATTETPPSLQHTPASKAIPTNQQLPTPNQHQLESPAVAKQKARNKYLPQGLSTVSTPINLQQPWNSNTSLADLSLSSSSFPLGTYLTSPKNLIPEAEAEFYYDPLPTSEKVNQINYGCKALIAERIATGDNESTMILYRNAIHDLIQASFFPATAMPSKPSSSSSASTSSSDIPDTTHATDAANQHSSLYRPHTVYVDGWTGSGKSIGLYTLAALGRLSGYITLYIPSAKLLTQGGRYYPSDVEGDAMWDTPEAARSILTAVVNAHGDQLANIQYSPSVMDDDSLPSSSSSSSKNQLNTADDDTMARRQDKISEFDGKTLKEIADIGLSSSVSARETVMAAIAIKDGLLSAAQRDPMINVLVAIDEYNALYQSKTEYCEPMHVYYRRPLSCDELRLASAFRVLEPGRKNLASNKRHDGARPGIVDGEHGLSRSNTRHNCVVVVSPSYSGGISPKIRIPRVPGTHTVRFPRYNVNEVCTVAAMLTEKKILHAMPSEQAMCRALALTNGNGKEIRENATSLLQDDDPYGVSLGYKAMAALRKEFSNSMPV